LVALRVYAIVDGVALAGLYLPVREDASVDVCALLLSGGVGKKVCVKLMMVIMFDVCC